MHCAQKMTHNIYWIGSNDWTTERFENLFPIPNGVSYNSYFIDDEKTCVVDSVDAEIREEYFDNLTHLLNGRELDYIVVNHMEPDHCQTCLLYTSFTTTVGSNCSFKHGIDTSI